MFGEGLFGGALFADGPGPIGPRVPGYSAGIVVAAAVAVGVAVLAAAVEGSVSSSAGVSAGGAVPAASSDGELVPSSTAGAQ